MSNKCERLVAKGGYGWLKTACGAKNAELVDVHGYSTPRKEYRCASCAKIEARNIKAANTRKEKENAARALQEQRDNKKREEVQRILRWLVENQALAHSYIVQSKDGTALVLDIDALKVDAAYNYN